MSLSGIDVDRYLIKSARPIVTRKTPPPQKKNMKPIFPFIYNQSTSKMCTGKYYKRLMSFAQNPS